MRLQYVHLSSGGGGGGGGSSSKKKIQCLHAHGPHTRNENTLKLGLSYI